MADREETIMFVRNRMVLLVIQFDYFTSLCSVEHAVDGIEVEICVSALVVVSPPADLAIGLTVGDRRNILTRLIVILA